MYTSVSGVPILQNGNLEGKIIINRENIEGKNLYEINAKTGSVFQNPRTQFFDLDTDGELVFGMENRGEPVEDIIANKENTIEQFSLQPFLGRNIHHLSGGEQQKIACASVYCANPDLYVFDEPTSNLDEDEGARFYKSI